jgi:DNA-binding CsgD family transcriptional regulator
MQHLPVNDARAVLDYVSDAYAIAPPQGFRLHALERLRVLIPSDMTAWVETGPGGRDATAIASPGDLLPDGPRRFARIRNEHPVLAHFERSRHGGAVDLSDFFSRTQLHDLRFYREFLHPAGVEHQMSIALPCAGTRLIRITLNRSDGRFGERDRLVLNLLRPHLARAWQNAATLERLDGDRRSLEQVAASLEVGVIIVKRGRPGYVNPLAREQLAAYFGSHAAHRLPPPLARWLATQRAPAAMADLVRPLDPFVVEGADGHLEVQAMPDGAGQVLVLRDRRTGLTARGLESLGLTRRQAEVLAWMTHGKTNAEIATILAISTHTVARHVEAVFDRLGVRSRTAAAATAFAHVAGS